jgi:type I restriction enzyme M protein
MNTKDIVNNILLPKYYNPDLANDLNKYVNSGDFELKSIGELAKAGILIVTRGDEVGSAVYGTGDIPFVRTSEISNWEITSDCTHCVSEDVYNFFKDKQKLEVEDILVVNDGTYLMGRAAMITESDLKIVIQSHFRRIKILKKDVLSPYLLLALLGMEIVQRQIESKSFRQGTISTLGSRLLEVKIPIPTNEELKTTIIEETRSIIEAKNVAKLKAQSYVIMNRTENLMGIKNKAKIGNL